MMRSARFLALCAIVLGTSFANAQVNVEDTIAKVKGSVVAVGTFERTRNPSFQFMGTGFAVGDGTLIATNDHVLPATLDSAKREEIAILLPAPPRDGKEQVQVRIAKAVARDPVHDLALVRIEGQALQPLAIGDASSVREGREVRFTGFPIGAILGAIPATHRATVAAITPIAIPQRRDAELTAALIRRLQTGTFPVFQLDGTAYPGNSGSPVYEAGSGAVIAIVNMVLVKATKESMLAQPSGIAYAIPAQHLRDLMATVR
ncbi:MAG TPA: serine protease [Casimicrobiaceae bacterium]|nr:serine protease [Casimicrobiaceae bacterium]